MKRRMTRREFIGTALKGSAGALAAGALPGLLQAADGGEAKHNVLFIAVDDLRPLLGCYGDRLVKTPHMDALAGDGIVFNRAYCQQAVCSPSRTSLMTGLRPETVRIYDLQTHFRRHTPNVVTLPQQFKRHGCYARSFGKIYHAGRRLDDPPSWSAPAFFPNWGRYRGVPSWESLDEPFEDSPKTMRHFTDVETARHARNWLRYELKKLGDEKFFLAAGFIRPHLPFVAPKEFYDLYPPEVLRLPGNYRPPENAPPMALHRWGELRNYSDIPKTGPITDGKALELIRGYYAATSYVDACIGILLNELDRLKLRDKTVIVLWGDHGWHLGENSLWCKHTNFEVATRSPLIISAPGMKNAGARTDALVEFVDIYPTLCDLCELPIPEHVEGTSVVPVMERPDREWKRAAFSLYPRFTKGGAKKGRIRFMGYSMRTERHRYTEWVDLGGGDPRGWVGQKEVGWIDSEMRPAGVELYDHDADPGETVNIAGRPRNEALVSKLAGTLRAGWRAALPEGRDRTAGIGR